MKATWNGTVVAESDATVIVEGNNYFPPDSIKKEFFLPSQTHTTVGPPPPAARQGLLSPLGSSAACALTPSPHQPLGRASRRRWAPLLHAPSPPPPAFTWRAQCGWKGVASYYTLSVGGQENKDAAWFYPEVLPKANNIKGYVAFWKGVKVGE
jgi:uncharacterized protein (DUF427 family)